MTTVTAQIDAKQTLIAQQSTSQYSNSIAIDIDAVTLLCVDGDNSSSDSDNSVTSFVTLAPAAAAVIDSDGLHPSVRGKSPVITAAQQHATISSNTTIALLLCFPLIFIGIIIFFFGCACLSRDIITDAYGMQTTAAQQKPRAATIAFRSALPHGCSYWQSSQLYWIYQRVHQRGLQQQPAAVVYVLHSYGEHSNRQSYLHLAAQLNSANVLVVCCDAVAHGRSSGSCRGLITSLAAAAVADVFDTVFLMERRMEKSGIRVQECPRFLLGHGT